MHWVFVAVHGLSLVAASRGYSLQLTGLVAPRHVGSSRTRARSYVACAGRRILNHCTTREVPVSPSTPSFSWHISYTSLFSLKRVQTELSVQQNLKPRCISAISRQPPSPGAVSGQRGGIYECGSLPESQPDAGERSSSGSGFLTGLCWPPSP